VAEKNIVSWILFSIWVIHYINRSIIFPMRIRNTSKIPISVIASAIFFNLVNGFINGYYIGNIINFPITYLYSMKFILGFIILIIGVTINTSADKVLIKIRNQNIGYQIPTGGLYKYITCPNYFGEIIQWTGFAIITWSFPALLFVLWTMANLIPRAKAYNNWYRLKFEGEYPNNKKAIIPYII
jgi:protein-S-isoprenylcysteine O-methyltransferase Ste14